MRGVSSEDLRAVGIEGVVVNAFHLLRRPGARVVQAAGGIHRFMDWDRPIVSDSGGFQIWSLIRQDPNRGVIRDNEVIFREPTTGEKWNLTPERIVNLQLQLGSDVVVCLDDCTDAEAPEAEQERSVERTVRWARRCREELDRLVRSAAGAPADLRRRPGRRRRATAAAVRDRAGGIGFDGYGFGGWPLAADGALLAEPMRWVVESLPPTRPSTPSGSAGPITWSTPSPSATRSSTAPCRRATRATAGSTRSATAGPHDGREPGDDFYRAVRIHDPPYRVDHGPIEDGCDCPVCARHSAAYLHHLFKVGDTSAERLATLHNLRFYVRLFELLRLVTSGVGGGLGGVLAAERVRAHASRAREALREQLQRATADASSDPATAGTRPVCGRTIRPAGVSSGSSSPAISSPTIAVAGTASAFAAARSRCARSDGRRAVGQNDDQPRPAGDGGEVAVQDGLELVRRGRLTGSLADLERELASRDRVGP